VAVTTKIAQAIEVNLELLFDEGIVFSDEGGRQRALSEIHMIAMRYRFTKVIQGSQEDDVRIEDE
jgi:hypothetical protein